MRFAYVGFPVLLSVVSLAPAGEPRFSLPLTIPGVQTPVTVAGGDIDGDGRLDLLAGSGALDVTVLIQDAADRSGWQKSTVRLAGSVYFVLPVDLDGDGRAEVLACDTAATAFLIPNEGGALGKPRALTQASTARWITAGDWDRDGLLDCATANFAAQTVSVFAGTSPGLLRFVQNYAIAEPHAVEGSDHDGDGDLDLLVGHGDHGLRTFKNGGDGRFTIQGLVGGFVPCARYVYAADFNQDGLGDAALTCLRFGGDGNIVGNALVGTSRGDGTFALTLDVPTLDIATLAIADLNGDARRDLALVSVESVVLSTYLGQGDGTFAPPAQLGATGSVPSFLAAPDLDGDARADVVSANTGSSSLTVFWGQEGERFLAGGRAITGSNGSPAAIADLDGDRSRDLFFSTTTPPGVTVHFSGSRGKPAVPSLTIPTPIEYDDLTVTDWNGDGVPDLIGKDTRSGTLRVSSLSPAGAVLGEMTWPVADPASVVVFDVARLDADAAPDVAAARLGASDVSIFINGGGALVAGPTFPTVERRRLIVLEDVDGDGVTDLLAAATGIVGLHLGKGDGSFGEAAVIFQGDPPRAIADVIVAELSGDAHLDVAIAIPGRPEIGLVRGQGGRAFEMAVSLEAPAGVRSLSTVDWNGDGRRDLTLITNDAISVYSHRGAAGLGPREEAVRLPPGAVDHLVEDLDGDGLPELILFGAVRTYVFNGVPGSSPAATFRRGDADASGKAEITDAVLLLEHLFRSGPPPCADASDADDNGELGLTDALVLLRWLFQGGPAPAAPGPEDCGEDPTGDELEGCGPTCE